VYCFANLNRKAKGRVPNFVNPIEKLVDRLSRERAKQYSPIGYFLRNKYPIGFSNTTDPFQSVESKFRASLAFLKWAAAMNQPLWIQTKGGILADPGEFEKYSPFIRAQKDVVYITITTLDDDIARRFEPGSPTPSERLKLAEKLAEKGVPVIVGCNPYVAEWVPDKTVYCETLVDVGARGIWLTHLHLLKSQASTLADDSELPKLANRGKDFLANFQDLKDWYVTTRDHGLIFFPNPYIDAWLGYASPFSDCVKADDFGPNAKLFTYTYDFMKHVQYVSHDGDAFTGDLEYKPGEKVVVRWANLEAHLRKSGLDNVLLDTNEFWIPHDARLSADRHEWKITLGTRASLYSVLRYFWNHAHENAQLCWDNPLLQVLKNFETDKWIVDYDHNLIGIYNPDIRMQSPIPEAYDYRDYVGHEDEFIVLDEKEE
jgi:DNA repair photolyase